MALLMAYYFYAKGNDRAILPLSLFNTRTFRLGIAANIFIRLSGSAVPFLLPLMFQLSFGYSAEVVRLVACTHCANVSSYLNALLGIS